jgi:hypothetical protein
MSWISLYGENSGKLILNGGEEKLFELTKIRLDAHCNICRNSIKSGCYCLGKGSAKVCLDCSSKMIDNMIDSMKEYILNFNKIKNDLNKNKMEYMRHNLANSL